MIRHHIGNQLIRIPQQAIYHLGRTGRGFFRIIGSCGLNIAVIGFQIIRDYHCALIGHNSSNVLFCQGTDIIHVVFCGIYQIIIGVLTQRLFRLGSDFFLLPIFQPGRRGKHRSNQKVRLHAGALQFVGGHFFRGRGPGGKLQAGNSNSYIPLTSGADTAAAGDGGLPRGQADAHNRDSGNGAQREGRDNPAFLPFFHRTELLSIAKIWWAAEGFRSNASLIIPVPCKVQNRGSEKFDVNCRYNRFSPETGNLGIPGGERNGFSGKILLFSPKKFTFYIFLSFCSQFLFFSFRGLWYHRKIKEDACWGARPPIF